MEYWISLGSNEEPRLWYLKKAIELISEVCKIEKISSLYESGAWGFEGYPFLNVCLKVESDLPPRTLFMFFKRIEKFLGREERRDYAFRFGRSYSSRPIDIDIIFWEGGIWEEEELKIPHPLAHKRKFILIPILEIEDIIHPLLRQRISEILEELEDTSWIEKVGRLF